MSPTLIIVAFVCVFAIAAFISWSNTKKEGLGVPLFDSDGKPCEKLNVGQRVTALLPVGVVELEVDRFHSVGTAELKSCVNPSVCGDYIVHASRKTYTFSKNLADKLAIGTTAWVIDDVKRRDSPFWYTQRHSGISYSDNSRLANARWLENDSVFGDVFDVTEDFLYTLGFAMVEDFDCYFDDWGNTDKLANFTQVGPEDHEPDEPEVSQELKDFASCVTKVEEVRSESEPSPPMSEPQVELDVEESKYPPTPPGTPTTWIHGTPDDYSSSDSGGYSSDSGGYSSDSGGFDD